jgi:hypothetical protein
MRYQPRRCTLCGCILSGGWRRDGKKQCLNDRCPNYHKFIYGA